VRHRTRTRRSIPTRASSAPMAWRGPARLTAIGVRLTAIPARPDVLHRRRLCQTAPCDDGDPCTVRTNASSGGCTFERPAGLAGSFHPHEVTITIHRLTDGGSVIPFDITVTNVDSSSDQDRCPRVSTSSRSRPHCQSERQHAGLCVCWLRTGRGAQAHARST
jgi:hypothetical protein